MPPDQAPTSDRVPVRIADIPSVGVRLVKRSVIFCCPFAVPKDATNVKIAAYPPTDGDAFRVVLAPGKATVEALPRRTPEPGERVLLCLLSQDLLSLFVATVEPTTAGGAP